MTDASADSLSFKVGEALVEDVGRGLVRLDADDLKRLHATPGTMLMITGRRPAVARAAQAPSSHCGQLLVLMDGVTRENAQAGVDEYVTVQKVPFKTAESILLAPADDGQLIPADEEVPHLHQLLLGLPILIGDRLQVAFLGSRPRSFTVEGAAPRGALLVSADTAITLKSPDAAYERAYRVSYEDIGGLDREVARVREMLELPLKFPQIFARLGIDPPKGLLLTGPPGTGKTLIGRAVSSEVRAHFIQVNGPEIIHKFYGESEAKLRQVFEEARRNAPSIIFLDEIDALAPKRTAVVGDVEKRVVAQLLALMDGLVDRGDVVVIGATNLPDLVDAALRRPGRFDREIAIGVPDQSGRRAILAIHSRRMPLEADVDLDQLAEITHGYVGADLAVLCKEAGMVALRRFIPQVRFEPDVVPHVDVEQVRVTRADFMAAFKVVEPSATREILAEHPRVTFADVGGLVDTKRTLLSVAELARSGGAGVGEARFNPPKGILLTGASGTGKTLLARALAGQLRLTLITVDQPTLLSKWVGESEKGLREVFRRAKQASPCIVFFDEIESLVPARSVQEAGSVFSRLVSQLFRELDDLHGSLGVVVLGATNRPELMDPALLRAGRFDCVLELGLPDAEERAEILRMHTEDMPIGEEVSLRAIAERATGWTGADLELMCKNAALAALEDVRERRVGAFRVLLRHVREAEAQVRRTQQAVRRSSAAQLTAI